MSALRRRVPRGDKPGPPMRPTRVMTRLGERLAETRSVHGVFAVTWWVGSVPIAAAGRRTWTVTHVPTGLMVTGFPVGAALARKTALHLRRTCRGEHWKKKLTVRELHAAIGPAGVDRLARDLERLGVYQRLGSRGGGR